VAVDQGIIHAFLVFQVVGVDVVILLGEVIELMRFVAQVTAHKINLVYIVLLHGNLGCHVDRPTVFADMWQVPALRVVSGCGGMEALYKRMVVVIVVERILEPVVLVIILVGPNTQFSLPANVGSDITGVAHLFDVVNQVGNKVESSRAICVDIPIRPPLDFRIQKVDAVQTHRHIHLDVI
jgi:hypothetical protein